MDMITDPARLAVNYRAVCNQISEAADRCGRSADSVRLIAVTKYVDYQACRSLIELGAGDLGENRVQVLVPKVCQAQAEGFVDVGWHMIGHLQTNKVREVLPYMSMMHSVDSIRLVECLQTELVRLGRSSFPVLLEVNQESESSKTGCNPLEICSLLDRALELDRIEVRGLMTMGALGSSPAEAARTFNAVAELRDDLQSQFGDQVSLVELSMGMSHDFSEAIAAGATMVRIGSALFV